jgi:hypothetical protein
MEESKQPIPLGSAELDHIRNSIRESQGWMKFLGILGIVAGALQALTIVGILVAWIPIWIGVLLFQAGNKGSDYVDRLMPADLVDYHLKLKNYFTILGIMAIVFLGLAVLGIIIGIIAAAAGALFFANLF